MKGVVRKHVLLYVNSLISAFAIHFQGSVLHPVFQNFRKCLQLTIIKPLFSPENALLHNSQLHFRLDFIMEANTMNLYA